MTPKTFYDNLRQLGIPRHIAGVLDVLKDGEPHTMKEIEHDADLRQSEVSIAVKNIGGVSIRKLPKSMGRPEHSVSMSKSALQVYVSGYYEIKRRDLAESAKAMALIMREIENK